MWILWKYVGLQVFNFKWYCNIIWMSIFCEKLEDIQMILQLSECLSATNICEQNTTPMCDFMFMQHNSHSDKNILKSKDLKVYNFIGYPYLYGQSLKKKDEILDLVICPRKFGKESRKISSW